MVNFPESNQNQDINPPWMEGSKDISGQEMIVVHMSEGELEGLDNMQQYPSIDPDTGIREYSALANVIEIPEVRNIFKHVSDEILEHGKLSPDLNKIYDYACEHSLPYKPTPEEKHNPLKKAGRTGREGDTKLALIPLNLALFLIELRHEPSINPKTGLLEFRWFNEIIRAAGTVVGAVFGGPVGAGLGNALAGKLTGKSWGNAAKSGLKIGAATYGLQGLGQAAGLLGGAPNLLAKGLNSFGNVLPGMGQIVGKVPLSTTGIMQASQQGGASNPVAAQQSSPSGFMSNIGSFMSKAAPLAPLGMAGLAYMGSRQHRKHQKNAAEEERNYLERERERMGFNRSLAPLPPISRRYNPRFSERSDLERKYGIFPEPAFENIEERGYYKGGPVKSYKRGSLVSGPGKGQDDKIKTSVPDGSYIIDASSTSMFGDGSTKAGSDILKDFEKHIKSKFPSKYLKKVENYISKTTSQVPVWLSEGEHKIDPVTVTLLGSGSNVNGADILKNMVINLRKHKISKGDGLPPKAKYPIEYISK